MGITSSYSNAVFHGLTGYVRHGCRCDVCRAAKREAEIRSGVPRDCAWCGNPYRASKASIKKGMGRFCSQACYQARRLSGFTYSTRRAIRSPDHPLANSQGKVLLYRHVLYERLGPGAHPCHWCGTEVTWVQRRGHGSFTGDLIVDHLNGDMLDNRPENLVAACNECNILRSFIRGWQERHDLPIHTLVR
jgi:hypothetical protein